METDVDIGRDQKTTVRGQKVQREKFERERFFVSIRSLVILVNRKSNSDVVP